MTENRTHGDIPYMYSDTRPASHTEDPEILAYVIVRFANHTEYFELMQALVMPNSKHTVYDALVMMRDGEEEWLEQVQLTRAIPDVDSEDVRAMELSALWAREAGILADAYAAAWGDK